MTRQVLLVDDDAEATLSLARVLKSILPQVSINAASSVSAAEKLAGEITPHVFVLDLVIDPKVGVESGFRLLSSLLKGYPMARIIMLTGSASVEHGVQALQLGAASFLEKPADPSHLAALIKDALSQVELREAYQKLAHSKDSSLESMLVGGSATIAEVRKQIEFFAQNNQPVFISGETGTGKGVVALAIHNLSKRSAKPFVRYQPSFANADLVGSELFGHRKNSFTGASEERQGLLSDADGGTLFLDEVDQLPLETQVSLLGVLQDRRFRQIGANAEQPCDFRLIAASNCDIKKAVSAGNLRQDFYHRIAHATIAIPPLRQRGEDIPALSSHFLQQLRRKEQLNVYEVSQAAHELLAKHRWPGNVRELEAVIEGAAYRAEFERSRTILPIHIGIGVSAGVQGAAGGDLASQVEAFKLKLIEEALDRNSGNQVQTALELKVDRSTMRRFLNRTAGI